MAPEPGSPGVLEREVVVEAKSEPDESHKELDEVRARTGLGVGAADDIAGNAIESARYGKPKAPQEATAKADEDSAPEDLVNGAPWRKRPHERRRGPATSTEISIELSSSERLTRGENTRIGET